MDCGPGYVGRVQKGERGLNRRAWDRQERQRERNKARKDWLFAVKVVFSLYLSAAETLVVSTFRESACHVAEFPIQGFQKKCKESRARKLE